VITATQRAASNERRRIHAAQAFRKREDRLDAAGLCRRCGRVPRTPGVTCCAACRERLSKWDRDRERNAVASTPAGRGRVLRRVHEVRRASRRLRGVSVSHDEQVLAAHVAFAVALAEVDRTAAEHAKAARRLEDTEGRLRALARKAAP
jgi:hypothetical protein